ncbi:reverse transcriptase domain-containing protein [Tanacetum coccineum]
MDPFAPRIRYVLRDKKEQSNLACRSSFPDLRTPHQDKLENQEDPLKHFPLETLVSVALPCVRTHGYARFLQTTMLGSSLSGNVIQQKTVFKMSNTTFGITPSVVQNLWRTNDPAGIDFIGPFPSSRCNKYILVAVDYLSKWVEAKALPTNDARVVCKFLLNLSLPRFRWLPRAIIKIVNTFICNDQFCKGQCLNMESLSELSTAIHAPRHVGRQDMKSRWSDHLPLLKFSLMAPFELSQNTSAKLQSKWYPSQALLWSDIPAIGMIPDRQTFA